MKTNRFYRCFTRLTAIAIFFMIFTGCEKELGVSSPTGQLQDGVPVKELKFITWGSSQPSLEKKYTTSKFINHVSGGEIVMSYGAGTSEWDYAIFAGEDIEIGIRNGVDIGGNGTITGNMCSNADFELDEDDYTLNGSVIQSETFVNGPSVDWNVYKVQASAAGQFVNGAKTFNEAGSPYTGVWYVTGEARLYANTVINGTIVTKENFELSGGNIEINAPANLPAIVVGGVADIDEDDVTINGLVYCVDNFYSYADDLTVTGAVISMDDVENEGKNFTVTYDANYLQDLAGISFAGPGDVSVTLSFTVLPDAMQASEDILISCDDQQLSGGIDLTFGPSGTTFNPDAILNVTATGLDLSGINPNAVDIYYDNKITGQWELMPSDQVIVNVQDGTIQVINGLLPHFSRYGIAAN